MKVSSLWTQPLDAYRKISHIRFCFDESLHWILHQRAEYPDGSVHLKVNLTLRVTALFEFMVDSKNLQARRSQKSIRPEISHTIHRSQRRWSTYACSYGEDVSFERNTSDAAARVAGGDLSHRLQCHFMISSERKHCKWIPSDKKSPAMFLSQGDLYAPCFPQHTWTIRIWSWKEGNPVKKSGQWKKNHTSDTLHLCSSRRFPRCGVTSWTSP